ncbi:MAG: ATP-binding protein [Nitrospinota bacterium]|nr:ATP-binding protein [Nitrospinota bacterium]MDH5756672.1 ATP-binding protein [Nitrospinota bacterium]
MKNGIKLTRGGLLETLAKYVGMEKADTELQKVYASLGLEKDARLGQEEFEKVVAQVESSMGRDVGEAMARAVITDKLEMRPGDMGRFYESFMRMRRSLLERQRKAERLNERLARLKELYESVSWSLPMGLCSVDMEMKVTTWNLGMEKLTGVEGEAAAGSEAAQLLPEYSTLMKKALERKERISEKRLVHILPTGRRRIESVVVSPMVDRYGVTRGLLILVEDVTSHALLEESAQRAEKLASVGSLAAGMAHEVGNPITSIWALAQELSGPDGEDREFRNRSLGQISHHIGRINDILKSLVDYSRQKDFSIAPVSLAQVVMSAVDLTRMGRKGNNVAVVVHLPESLPRVLCDADQIEQVLINLLFNAVDASPPGSAITVLAEAAPKGFVTVTVEDKGAGMSRKTQEKLFTPFFTTKPVGAGTGLGLFVCYNIMENHGGELQVKSAPGKGTAISFSLKEAEGESDV